VTRIPIFPLRSVLCPGVALPLHIFEERYRLMVDRCIERGEGFGVVLIREGREVGPLNGEIAAVGTTAVIRKAGRYPDGRLDILTVGQRRFHVEAVDSDSEPYLVGQVSFLEEPTGAAGEARRVSEQVGRRFMDYLALLQPDTDDGASEIEIEFEIEVDTADDPAIADHAGRSAEAGQPSTSGTAGTPGIGQGETPGILGPLADGAELSAAQRRELLMAAARRLTATDDPTALSYVLTALVQVDLASRQALLEAPDTVARLRGLDHLLERESWFLRQGLRPIIIDPNRV